MISRSSLPAYVVLLEHEPVLSVAIESILTNGNLQETISQNCRRESLLTLTMGMVKGFQRQLNMHCTGKKEAGPSVGKDHLRVETQIPGPTGRLVLRGRWWER